MLVSSSSSSTASNTRAFTEIDPLALSSLATPMSTPSPSARSKTNAFFSSSFTTRPSSPALPPKPSEQQTPKPKSLTAAFFSTSSTPSPPPAALPPKKTVRNFLNLELGSGSSPVTASFALTPSPTTADHNRNIDSAGTANEPTPKPPALTVRAAHDSPNGNVADTLGTEPDAEVLSNSRSLSKLSPSSQAYIASHIPRSPSTYPHQFVPSLGEQGQNLIPATDEEELAPGMIIRSFLPSSDPNSSSTSHHPASSPPLAISASSSESSTSSNNHSDSNQSTATPGFGSTSTHSVSKTIPVTLRLTRPLGQGSFSSVWLAEDLSPTSLLLRSRRSLRDLKRKASSGSTLSSHSQSHSHHAQSTSSSPAYGTLTRKSGEKKPKALSSTSNLMRKLRGGVSGTRPLQPILGNGNERAYSSSSREKEVVPPVPPLPHYLVPGGLPLSVNEGAGIPSLSRASSISWRSDGETEFEEDDNTSAEGVIRKASVKSVASVSRSGSERSVRSTTSTKSRRGRLVAVKLTSRGVVEHKDKDKNRVKTRLEIEEERERDRTRVSFVREVEVLKHISHPNITPLLSHLTTRTHHVLVMPYLPGGDLLGLVNDELAWNNLAESTVRRIFAELCKAVSWMHSVGLVHRDIKLENVLLTVSLNPASVAVADSSRQGSEEYGTPATSRSNGIRPGDDETHSVFSDKMTNTSPTSFTFATSESSVYGSTPNSPTTSVETSFPCDQTPPAQYYHTQSHPAEKFSRYPSDSSISNSASPSSSWFLSASESDPSASSRLYSTQPLDSRSHTLVPSDFERKPTSASPSPQIPPPSHPLIKLTDFGLSRFIDPAKPLLTTRCGSEAYAAPELVMSGGRAGVASGGSRWVDEADGEEGGYASEAGRSNKDKSNGYSSSGGGYDARETDAWACGVVLYALVARRLPFGEGPGEALIGNGKLGGNARSGRPVGASERRQWLMKIARGDWQWPAVPDDENSGKMEDDGELRGMRLAESQGAKRVAERLLVRDPTRRWRLKDLWDDEWVAGTGIVGSTMLSSQLRASPSPRVRVEGLPRESEAKPEYVVKIHDDSGMDVTGDSAAYISGLPGRAGMDEVDVPIQRDADAVPQGDVENDEDDEEDEEDGAEDGWLVDKEGIKSIAREEVQ